MHIWTWDPRGWISAVTCPLPMITLLGPGIEGDTFIVIVLPFESGLDHGNSRVKIGLLGAQLLPQLEDLRPFPTLPP